MHHQYINGVGVFEPVDANQKDSMNSMTEQHRAELLASEEVDSLYERRKPFHFGVACESVADLVFIVLPLVILLFVNKFKGGDYWGGTWYSAEIGIAASIIFGQTMVKLISSFMRVGNELDKGKVALIFAIVVFSLVFSVIAMTFVMVFGTSTPEWILNFQLAMLGLSFLMHFIYFSVKQQLSQTDY
jgi:hypothetical protein